MRVGAHKDKRTWKAQTYPVPTPSVRRLRWKSAVLCALDRWNRTAVFSQPATIVVPALYNFMPAENVALGWLNEIDALTSIRQHMATAAEITGWDAFTFHTLHNADRYFDTTIRAVRDTWAKEGKLSMPAVREARRQFGSPCDYHRIHARLVENLVFQSSLLGWVARHSAEVPLRFHVIGTALLSALVSAGSIPFSAAVKSAMSFGHHWDETVRSSLNAGTEEDAGWAQFCQVRRLIEGRVSLAIGVSREQLPVPDAPARPFWYSATMTSEPILITTAQEAANALETLNLASWTYAPARATVHPEEPVRGWLVSPLHPMARVCRWSFSNYLLATPGSVGLFLDHIATLARKPIPQLPVTASESLATVENEGHRSLIGELHVHHRLKYAGRHRNS